MWATPFELVCRMATPIALNHPWLHLDGIVTHLVYQRVAGRAFYELPTKQVCPVSKDRMGRFARRFEKRDGVRCASVSFFEPDKLGSLQFFKRPEAEGMPGVRKLTISNGQYRAWMLRTVYQACHTATFYGCGDVPVLRAALEDLTHLGDDVRVGWGRVAAWDLREITEDKSVVWEGRAMRPIPVDRLRRYSDAVPLAWYAPYWAPQNVALCAPPGAEVDWL